VIIKRTGWARRETCFETREVASDMVGVLVDDGLREFFVEHTLLKSNPKQSEFPGLVRVGKAQEQQVFEENKRMSEKIWWRSPQRVCLQL
jgi:hypothetical protein